MTFIQSDIIVTIRYSYSFIGILGLLPSGGTLYSAAHRATHNAEARVNMYRTVLNYTENGFRGTATY